MVPCEAKTRGKIEMCFDNQKVAYKYYVGKSFSFSTLTLSTKLRDRKL